MRPATALAVGPTKLFTANVSSLTLVPCHTTPSGGGDHDAIPLVKKKGAEGRKDAPRRGGKNKPARAFFFLALLGFFLIFLTKGTFLLPNRMI